MSNALLSKQDQEAALSKAYATAIAARAGYTTYVPDLDRDSIDLGFAAGGQMRPNLHAQLKATINLRRSGGHFKFALQKKNYDDLRVATQTPRILVVLSLPRKEETWLHVSVTRLILRRCAFWVSLNGMPELPDGKQSTTVALPVANVFDVAGLKVLMERIANRGSVV